MDSAPNAAEQPARPWRWVPSLYFAQGVPNVVVTGLSVIMLKRLGLENAEIAYYTSILGLPWVLKPLWSPLVQRIGTRRGWVIVTQLLVALGLAAAALSIPAPNFVRLVLAAFAFIAVASATHDVAADGFYMLALSSHQQAWFVGIRSTAFRAAMVVGSGLLVMLAGRLEARTGLPTVHVHVAAAANPPAAIAFDAAAAPVAAGAAGITVSQNVVDLSINERTESEVNAIVDAARKWNIDHGFYEAQTAAEKKDKAPWVKSLEGWIRSRFGRDAAEAETPDRAGDVAVLYLRLNRPVPADARQVVQFGLAKGDASFKVIEGERFVVTEANWQQPFAAVIQVEDKLDHASSAEFEVRSGNIQLAWLTTLLLAGGLFLAFCIYHYFILPRPAADSMIVASTIAGSAVTGFVEPIASFFRKPHIVPILAFLLLYRLPEAQLVKLVTPFLVDPREKGGLALTTGEVGFAYGTVGIIMLTIGGIVGGIVAARDGLKRWLWPMALAIHLPNAAFLFLAYALPENLWVITAAVGVEQFGYGFGFTAYMLYCLYAARGEHQTVHYALCTGCMALGMMIPGMWSGWLQQLIGYQHFFIWVMICTVISFATVLFIPLDSEFGKK